MPTLLMFGVALLSMAIFLMLTVEEPKETK